MKIVSISRHALLGAVLLAAWIDPASRAAAEDQDNTKPPDESAVPSHAAEDAQTVPTAASEPAVTCPCADDYAAAAAAYDARPGIPVHPQWDVCSVPHGGVGKNGASMTKFDALTPAQDGRNTTIFLNAARRWTFGGTHPVECSAWVIVDSPGVPKSLIGLTIRDKLSDAELAGGETLIRAIAKCPE